MQPLSRQMSFGSQIVMELSSRCPVDMMLKFQSVKCFKKHY